MNWTEKHIKGLLFNNKIRGFQAPPKKAADKRLPEKKSKALVWLDLNLQYWCNERALTLHSAATGGELQFDPDRKFRFDYAIVTPEQKIAIEYQGGIFMQKSGHTNVKGFNRDSEKFNRATVLGWKVITVNALNYTTVLKTLNEMI